MTRIALVVLCTFVCSSVQAETLLSGGLRYANQVQGAGCEESQSRGRADAGEHGTKGWFWGGFAAGAGVGLIGTGAVTVGSAFSNPKPKTVPGDVEPACYKAGYKGKAKGKNITAAAIGGVVGTAAYLGVAYTACASRYGRNSSRCAISFFPN